MELNIKTMNLSDLTNIKSILEQRLSQRENWRDSERGRNLEEYNRRELIYHQDENHSKLKRVNQRIEDFLNVVGQSEQCCEPISDGFYLGTSCPKFNKPFRQNFK